MGDAVLADLQGKRLLVAGVCLNQAFNDALDRETFECGVASRPAELLKRNHVPTVTTHGMSKLPDASMAERHVQAFNDTFGIGSCTTSSWPQQHKRRYEEIRWDRVPRLVRSPRHEQRDKDSGLRLGNANWRGQTPRRYIFQDEREGACTAAVAESGSQTLGVAVSSVALRLPLIKHPSCNQSATAPGCYTQGVLTEVSAGPNITVTRKVAYSMSCGI